MKKHGTDIQETLAERREQHGPFDRHANIEHELRNVMEKYCRDLDSIQMIGLGMIMHKIARILNEGQDYSDTWHDIAGYAILVEQDILNNE